MHHRHSISWRFRYSAKLCRLVIVVMMAGGSTVVAQQNPAAFLDPSPAIQGETQKVTAPADERLVVNTDLVTLTVSVVDADGHSVPGLQPGDFKLTDNQVPQVITFFSDADLPASIAVVFDVSGSMSGGKRAAADEALAHFVKASHQDDEYFLIAFNSRPQLLLDRSRDGDALISRLSSVKADGKTALYDAAYLALDRIAHGRYAKRAVLIISDGEDNDSRFTLNQLRQVLLESDVIIYAIDINPMPLPKEFYGRLVLDELANKSGGKLFTPRNNAEMSEAFDQIAVELRHQYSIGYGPTSFTADGRWHRLKIKVTPPPDLKRVQVRARAGYYAAPSPH